MRYDRLFVRGNCPEALTGDLSLRRIGYRRLRPPSFYFEDARSRRFHRAYNPVMVMNMVSMLMFVMLPGFGRRHEK
jgi:hypothetical protein